jgi:hypothetical protein
MYKDSAKEFISDINKWVFEKKGLYVNSFNKCDYSISNITKAFAQMESRQGWFWMSIPTKNWVSLHPSLRSKFYHKWDWFSTLDRWEVLRKYDNEKDAFYDFMYTYKFFYKCNISYNMILIYIYGSNWIKTDTQKNHARYYYNNLVYFLNQYETNDWKEKSIIKNSDEKFSYKKFKNTAIEFNKDKTVLRKDNQCKYPLSKIAYAFYVSSNININELKLTNNLYWLTSYNKGRKTKKTNDKSWYLYNNVNDSIYDFMYIFKTKYNCNVSLKNVKKWFYWNGKVDSKIVENKTKEIRNLLTNE